MVLEQDALQGMLFPTLYCCYYNHEYDYTNTTTAGVKGIYKPLQLRIRLYIKRPLSESGVHRIKHKNGRIPSPRASQKLSWGPFDCKLRRASFEGIAVQFYAIF